VTEASTVFHKALPNRDQVVKKLLKTGKKTAKSSKEQSDPAKDEAET
jgi:hypothetical protein